MQRIEQSGLIAVLADSLRKRGSWAGETHIQKAGYLLQELLGVPLNMKFILYKHGPFSFIVAAQNGLILEKVLQA
jgi:hypothetical protein